MKKYLNEIICYFRDFLETDFKKGRLPKRRIENIKRKKGNIIKTCVNCENYDGLLVLITISLFFICFILSSNIIY